MIDFLNYLINGTLTGLLYALIAMGFVVIYRASKVFNFAQGAMVFFAALTFVGVMELGLSPWLAFPVTLAVMVVLGLATERVVLRPLVNQPQITLFMATIGLAFFIEGLAQIVWGTEVRRLDLGLQDEPIESLMTHFNLLISSFDVTAAVVAGVLVAVLAVFFNRTRIGRALRAVADDHQAALAVGIPLKQIWAIVWSVAGFVALELMFVSVVLYLTINDRLYGGGGLYLGIDDGRAPDEPVRVTNRQTFEFRRPMPARGAR